MHRLALFFVGCLCDKYLYLMRWLISASKWRVSYRHWQCLSMNMLLIYQFILSLSTAFPAGVSARHDRSAFSEVSKQPNFLCLECVDAHADLILRWPHMQSCRKCHALLWCVLRSASWLFLNSVAPYLKLKWDIAFLYIPHVQALSILIYTVIHSCVFDYF